MSKPSKEFQGFDSLIGRLLTVPKSTIHERHAAHKKRAALNPNKRGPKPKIKPPSGDPDEA
jgi:hypothetical protein